MYRKLNEKEKEFIEEVIKLYDKYGLAISHEDGQGSFLIAPNKENYKKWIRNAYIDEYEWGNNK